MAEVSGQINIARVRPGQRSLPAAAWNEMAAAVEGGARAGLQGLAGAVAGPGIACTLVADSGEQGDDWLRVTIDETGEPIDVLKPPLLRPSVTARAGVSYSYANPQRRTADDGSATETQVIVEAYLVGDAIIARPHIAGDGTVVWMDSSARAWAKEST